MGVEDAAEVPESLRKQAAPRGHAFADRGCLCLQTCPPALSGPSLAFLAGGQAECSGPVSSPQDPLSELTNPNSMPLESSVVAALRACGDKVLDPTPRLLLYL